MPFVLSTKKINAVVLGEWAEYFELERTPDNLGFFGYKRHLGAYCEVISYSKLVSDAEKRNQAVFEKLGLPKRMTNTYRKTTEQSNPPYVDPNGR